MMHCAIFFFRFGKVSCCSSHWQSSLTFYAANYFSYFLLFIISTLKQWNNLLLGTIGSLSLISWSLTHKLRQLVDVVWESRTCQLFVVWLVVSEIKYLKPLDGRTHGYGFECGQECGLEGKFRDNFPCGRDLKIINRGNLKFILKNSKNFSWISLNNSEYSPKQSSCLTFIMPFPTRNTKLRMTVERIGSGKLLPCSLKASLNVWVWNEQRQQASINEAKNSLLRNQSEATGFFFFSFLFFDSKESLFYSHLDVMTVHFQGSVESCPRRDIHVAKRKNCVLEPKRKNEKKKNERISPDFTDCVAQHCCFSFSRFSSFFSVRSSLLGHHRH